MKKQIIISIASVLLLGLMVMGSTYAYFRTTLGSDNNINANTSIMNIIYTKGTPISGNMQLAADRSGGYSTEITIRTAADSVEPTMDLFLHIDDISSAIAVNGFKWEVCTARSGDTTACSQGTFAGYNDTDHNTVLLISDYQLNTSTTTFTVYLWLDGNLLDGATISGSTFEGYIGANSEQFTARFT